MLMMAVSFAFADDIVTMPTANQLKAGQVDAAGYYLTLHVGAPPNPQFVQYQTLYVGVTDKLEIDAHRSAVDNNETATILVASFKLLSEGPQQPDLVVGCRNLAGTATSLDNPGTPAIDERAKSEKQSYFLSAAKTLFFNPKKPGPPLVRAHLSVGTEDWTLLGEKRHEGIFGGLQFLLHPEVGLVVENDGRDTITALTLMPKNTGLTFKGGTYGKNSWVGVSYRTTLNF